MKKTKIIKINIVSIIIVVFIFAIIIFKLVYVSVVNIKVGNTTITEFANNRNTTKKTINAKRGSIYSSDNEVLAKDVNSYTVIAYLEPSRTKDESNPQHVTNKEYTAKMLSPIINMKESTILALLNTYNETCNEDKSVCTKKVPYQVELGPGGRNITELLKDQIDDLDLPGIDFIHSTKRYYPNGDFLSYTLGYAKLNSENNFVGEMGIEAYYNDELTGTNGYIEYQTDREGYQMTNTPTIETSAESGNDIYLTIDTNVQMLTEQAMNIIEASKPEWATISVVNAKTGEILGVSSSPSFNNNSLNITSYYDPFVSYEYEPGSTMKVFSFMAAMEGGIYDGTSTYKSGSLKVDDATIKDWNKKGWGTISYDEGFMGSSNVAASKLALSLGRAKLKDYYTSLGFGKQTGITLPNETKGTIDFKYNTEVASASYGQGISVSAIQMVQGFTTLANDGVMLKSYIVSKIVNSETNEIILQNERTEIAKVASSETVNNMIKLMRGVVDGSASMSTGTGYYLKGYDLIGKTGTAEIASSSGGYLTGSRNNIRSFVGIFPGEDPQIIIYVAASKMTSATYLKKAVKSLVQDVSTYLNIYNTNTSSIVETKTIDSYINKDTELTKKELKSESLDPIVIGDGNTIISQYPIESTKVSSNSKVFLLTNSQQYNMIDITSWSRGEVNILVNLLNLKASYEGYGYVKSYSILKNTLINKNDVLNVILEPNYKDKDDQ